MDWMPAKRKLIRQCVGAYVLTSGSFTEVYPMEINSAENAKTALNQFVTDVGIPLNLKTDLGANITGRKTVCLKFIK